MILPDWLAGDPLVGILTISAFFIFLNIGRTIKLRQLKRDNLNKSN